MKSFRFAIMGAGGIAHHFCDAVRRLDHCEVCAVSSKSMERAAAFAKRENIPSAYDSYEAMLEENEIDCVYIAVTTDSHYDLTMLCLDHRVPVLCEKAMFLNSSQAKTVFNRSRELGVFVMEAMWSRFLPAIRKSKEWLDDGKIGSLCLTDIQIGFYVDRDNSNRFFNPALGGGTAYDSTVYAFEMADYFLEEPYRSCNVHAIWSDSGVDVTSDISLLYSHSVASLKTTFLAETHRHILLYGEEGYILIPEGHMARDTYLYGRDGNVVEHFVDEQTENGFTYEIREVMDCIRQGLTESAVVPQDLTLRCALLFDEILKTKP